MQQLEDARPKASPIPSNSSHPLVHRLNEKLQEHLRMVEDSEVYQVVASPQTPRVLVIEVMKNIMLEVFSYGKDVVEATFTAIGRMPLKRHAIMKAATDHILEEVSHPDMALRDFERLGGDPDWARRRPMSPASFAMTATCHQIARRESPFAYLGFMYLFEAMTPILAARVQKFLANCDVPESARKFIDVHAEVDIRHTDELQALITKVIKAYPEAEKAIDYGFDCFRSVYPVPIWSMALASARAEIAKAAPQMSTAN